MKTVTYLDLEEAAPVVEVQGVVFESEKPVEVSDELATLLENNKFFDVAGLKRGRQAKADDKA